VIRKHVHRLPTVFSRFSIGGVLFLCCGIAILSTHCTRPELIGADLLEDEASVIGFTDTISLYCSHTAETSVFTFKEETGRETARNMIGKLDDPFFGKSEAEMYSEVFLFSGSSMFLGSEIDSVILSLRYDTLGLYGDLTQPVRFEAFMIEEELFKESDIRSDFAPMVGMQNVGWLDFMPHPHDSLTIISRGDTARIPPAVRIPMTPEFIASMLAQDSSTFESADSFRLWMKGLSVKMTQGTNTMLGFDLRNVWSGITIYYHAQDDTTNSEVFFKFIDPLSAGIHHSRFIHDYTGSVAETFLQNPELADSLLLVQGMSGLNVRIAIPGLRNLDNILINKAEIEFFAAELPEDSLGLYPRVGRLVTGARSEEGDVEYSEDVNTVLRLFNSIVPFGGELTTVDSTGAMVKRYRMNITASLQDVYKGITEDEIYVLPFLKASVPNRVILYGPGHPTYPARIRLTYTVVQ